MGLSYAQARALVFKTMQILQENERIAALELARKNYKGDYVI